jgi:hypothetical protein
VNQVVSDLREYLRSSGFADLEIAETPATVEDTFMARMAAPAAVAGEAGHG